jgi:hypothetical protein
MVEHKLQIRGREFRLHTSHVKTWVECVAAKMHNTLERWDSIHGDTIYSGLSSDMPPI